MWERPAWDAHLPLSLPWVLARIRWASATVALHRGAFLNPTLPHAAATVSQHCSGNTVLP